MSPIPSFSPAVSCAQGRSLSVTPRGASPLAVPALFCLCFPTVNPKKRRLLRQEKCRAWRPHQGRVLCAWWDLRSLLKILGNVYVGLLSWCLPSHSFFLIHFHTNLCNTFPIKTVLRTSIRFTFVIWITSNLNEMKISIRFLRSQTC